MKINAFGGRACNTFRTTATTTKWHSKFEKPKRLLLLQQSRAKPVVAIPGESTIQSVVSAAYQKRVLQFFNYLKSVNACWMRECCRAALDFSNFGINSVAFQVQAAQLISRRFYTGLCSIYYVYFYIYLYVRMCKYIQHIAV